MEVRDVDQSRACDATSSLGNGSAGARLAMPAKLLGLVEGNVGQS